MRGRSAPLILFLCACGDSAGDRAAAALRAGDWRDAERWAKELAPPVRDFVRGNVAFAHCEMAERQASSAAAEPFAWDVAISYGRRARDFWKHAAMSRPDWPEARRNVERALLKLDELAQKKKEAERKREPDRKPQPKPIPKAGKEDTRPPKDEPRIEELTPEQVLRLLDKLAKKEKEKVALRRSHRKVRMAEVERDW
jgi:hypothetical protein